MSARLLFGLTIMTLALAFLLAAVPMTTASATMLKLRHPRLLVSPLAPIHHGNGDGGDTDSVRVPAPPRSSSVFTELTTMLQQQQQQQQRHQRGAVAAPKYYLNVYSNATSCSGNMTTFGLDLFAGNLGKCVDGQSGLDSGVLQPCMVNPGGGSDFGYAFFSQPSCKGSVNTTLYAAGSPTNNAGCFLVLVTTPTAHGTVAIQAQCPSA